MNKLFLIIIVFFLSACSAGLAFSGTPEPDFNKLTKGQKRSIVEQEVGAPVIEKDLPGGKSLVDYVYVMGNHSAPLRGTMHVLLDIVTLFLWEYVGLIIEAANSGDAHDLQVVYSADEKLVSYEKIGKTADLAK